VVYGNHSNRAYGVAFGHASFWNRLTYAHGERVHTRGLWHLNAQKDTIYQEKRYTLLFHQKTFLVALKTITLHIRLRVVSL
jgi:hypothetical protein